jgi:parallel beta-helix repeat protein
MLGGTGILFFGDKDTPDKYDSNNRIENNEIYEIGQIYKTSPPVSIHNLNGNRVINNLIHHTPYSGIFIFGSDIRNNVVEQNEIHHICLEIHDGNVIHLNGDYCLIRRNYLHDNLSPKLHGIIRSDDDGKDMVITENIIYRFSDCAIKFKQSTTVTNNYLIDWVPSEWINGERLPMNQFLQIMPSGAIKGSVIKNNIYYQSAGATQPFFRLIFNSRYPQLKDLNRLSDIDMDNNLYYATGVYNDCVRQLDVNRKEGVDKNSMVADPLFNGFGKAGFKLNDNSPALQLGINQIDFENIGLLQKGK